MISEIEGEQAIHNLHPRKSPGPDDFSYAFYKVKHEIGLILTFIFDQAFDINALPPSYGYSHSVLIPKTDDGEKLRLVTAYRPIALTNVEYKIFIKILAARLQTVEQDVFVPHQTCGIKRRSISTNIQKARSVLICSGDNDGQVAMLQIDLEEAFRTVNHEILFSILNHVNVGSVICEGVPMANQHCTTRSIVNKDWRAPINVQRSVRQG